MRAQKEAEGRIGSGGPKELMGKGSEDVSLAICGSYKCCHENGMVENTNATL